MFDSLWQLRLVDGAVPIVAAVVAVIVAGLLTVVAIRWRRERVSRWRRVFAFLGGGGILLLSVLIGMNAVTGSFVTVGALAGKHELSSLSLPALAHGPRVSNWAAPASLPSHGSFGAV
ncbi:MAG: hypothetical protein ABI400_13130, partial [Lacisediminihabitans sp.]